MTRIKLAALAVTAALIGYAAFEIWAAVARILSLIALQAGGAS